MSYNTVYPKILGFGCTKAPFARKGATFLSENVEVTKKILKTKFGEKLKKLGVKYYRRFYDRNDKSIADNLKYLTWQSSFESSSKEETTKKLDEQSLEYNWDNNNTLNLIYSTDAYEYCEQVDKNLLFANPGQHSLYFDTYKEFIHLSNKDRPFDLKFGDGSDFSEEEIYVWQECYDEFTYPNYWEDGSIAILNNVMWTHAREPYELVEGEKRDLFVMLGERQEKIGSKEGKYY